MRPGEVFAMKLEDINTETQKIHIPDSKTDTARDVCFSPSWIPYFNDWRKLRPRCPHELVFCSAYAEPMNVNRFSKTFREKYKPLAKVHADLHLYSLRHYAITAIAQESVLAAQQQAGHASLKTTSIYAKTQDEHTRAMHERAAPLERILVNRRTEAQATAKRRKMIK